MNNDIRYGFGENWNEYIKSSFSEERLEQSRVHLLKFLKLNDLKGKNFLDIGCGSGLHSLAAVRSGAQKVLSIDYDEESVRTTELLYRYAGKPRNWEILRGSVLDLDFLASLGRYDIVYSWGVLHHTGDMWTAMKNVLQSMQPDGVLYISLYTSDVFIRPSPEFWLNIKRMYNRTGRFGQLLIESTYAVVFVPRELLDYLVKFDKRPSEKHSRGMSFWTNIRDWLGGWPMEFAGINEVKRFYINDNGMELLNMHAGEATTEYLFRHETAGNYWDDYLSSIKPLVLARPFTSTGGKAWQAGISIPPDNNLPMVVLEDRIPLGFERASQKHVKRYGKGRYVIQNDNLIFSTSDNTDPNCNGREYRYYLDNFALS